MQSPSNPKMRVKMHLDAIYATRRRARDAQEAGDVLLHKQIMGDLYTLTLLLVNETQLLINELDLMRPYVIKGGKANG